MTSGEVIAIIGGVTTITAIVLPIWINHWMNKQQRKMKAERNECKRELAEMRREYKKAIELAIEKSKNL